MKDISKNANKGNAVMKMFYLKEGRGLHAAVKFCDGRGPLETIALFRTERDARRFVDAGNRSVDIDLVAKDETDQ